MSQLLLMALAASLPLAVLAFIAAWAVETAGAGVKLRLCAWTAALLLPALPAPAMLAIHALGVPSPFAAGRQTPEPLPAAAVFQSGAARPSSPEPSATQLPHIPLVAIALGLIGAGAAFRIGQLMLGLRRVARLKAASEPILDADMAARLGRGVRLADTAAPILAGLIRPTILLPRRLVGGLSPEQAVLVCAHERAHLAAGDHLWRLMEETMVRLYWFNPVMAAVRERLAAAREEACDARALAGCDEGRRREYARTLIAALKLAGRAEPVAAFTGFRRRGAERRLKAILKPVGPGSWRAAAVAMLAGLGLAGIAGGFSLAAAAEPAPVPPPEAVASDPLPPPPPAPPADLDAPAPPAPPAPPPPPAHPPRMHTVVVWDDGLDGHPHAKVDGHTVDIHGDDWDFDSDAARQMTPKERAQLEADLKKAHEDVAKAMAESRAAMAGAHKEMIYRFQGLSPEQRAAIHKQVEDAMKQAHAAMAMAHQQMAQNDGRTPMRCKIGPDGKATDCVPFAGPMNFQLFREGPAAPPAPPAPPAPGLAPLPPPPPGEG